MLPPLIKLKVKFGFFILIFAFKVPSLLPNLINLPCYVKISRYPYSISFKILNTILSDKVYKLINFQKLYYF